MNNDTKFYLDFYNRNLLVIKKQSCIRKVLLRKALKSSIYSPPTNISQPSFIYTIKLILW